MLDVTAAATNGQCPAKPPTALIVEDDPDHLEILTKFFLRWGWNVCKVNDPNSLPRLPAVLTLIVLDRALPGLSGADVLRRLRSDGVTAPAVVVTGMPLDVDDDEFAGLDVAEIIGKDAAYSSLKRYAEALATGARTAQPDGR